MPFKKTLLAMMMCGVAAAQADYQAEIEMSFATGTSEIEFDDSWYDYDVDTDVLQLGGTVYFSQVSTANGPLDEAAFLSKSSGVSIGYVKSESEIDSDYGSDGADLDSDFKVIVGHFVLPSPNLIIEAAPGQGEDEEIDTDYYSLGFGGYINDRITLMAEYSKEEVDEDYVDDASTERFTVTYRQYIQFGGEQGLSIEPFIGSVDIYDENGVEFGIDAAWYITRSLGLKAGLSGFGVELDDGDYAEARSHIGIDYFINENFRIGGSLLSASSEFDSDFGGEDEESEGGAVEFNAAVRF